MAEALVKRGEGVSAKLNELLAGVQAKAPEEAKQITALVRAIEAKDVAILGEDEAFKLRDTSGEIRAFRSVLHLSATDGTLVQPVPKGPFTISAQGYERWEESAGVVTMKPPTVLVGGDFVPNPHVERDKDGNMLAIHCRTIAFRFTSKGIPQVSDWTTIFDLPSYKLIDLLAKAKNYPQAFKLLPNGMKPDEEEFTDGIKSGWGDQAQVKQVKVKPTWAGYKFDASTTFWVCTSHPEALQWYGQIINREKKAIDFAQTFSKRNALKHLSGLQKVPGQDRTPGQTNPINTWTIPVISWRPTSGSLVKWDLTRYSQVQKALVSAAQGETQALMIEAGREHVSDEAEQSAQEMKEIDQAEGDSFEEEQEPIQIGSGRAEPEKEIPQPQAKTEVQKQSPPPPPPQPPPGPRPPEPPPAGRGRPKNPPSPPPAEVKAEVSHLKQLEAFTSRGPKEKELYEQACQALDMRPMSDSGAKKILEKIDKLLELQDL